MAITLGSDTGGTPVGLLPTALRTHATIVGMTGSGKTGLILGMAEELVRNQIPVIILDIKGDMSNIFLQQDSKILDLMRPCIITPGANHGIPINITSGLRDPERVPDAVSALLNLIKVPSDPITSKQHTLISAILEDRHANDERCHLDDLVLAVQEPPFDMLGVMALEAVISKGMRKALAAKLNNVLVAKSFEHWREGIALDIKELISVDGTVRTPVVIYSVAHMANDEERMFAISLLLDEMVSFMRKSPGTDNLKTVFMVDECYGLMPPRSSSSTKKALLTLLKQGRSAGLGIVLSTQNTMDLEYKAVANCETWITGRLQTANDRRRLVEGICSAVPNMEKDILEAKIGALKPRHFLLARGRYLIPFLSRTTDCELRGPMNVDDIERLVPKPVTGVVSKVIPLFSASS